MYKTTDLSDEYPHEVQVAAPLLRDFGGVTAFHGPIATVQVQDDNTSVRALLETPGAGRVLVVDGGGSTRCALVGDRLAQLGHDHGWAGIVVHGCVRDVADLRAIPIGIKALAPMPRRSEKRGPGVLATPVTFAGVTFTPGHWLYADEDGIVVTVHPGSVQEAR
jgi:regulator of ribonuclease activity A